MDGSTVPNEEISWLGTYFLWILHILFPSITWYMNKIMSIFHIFIFKHLYESLVTSRYNHRPSIIWSRSLYIQDSLIHLETFFMISRLIHMIPHIPCFPPFWIDFIRSNSITAIKRCYQFFSVPKEIVDFFRV